MKATNTRQTNPPKDLAVGTVCVLAHIFERKLHMFFFQKKSGI